MLTILYVVHQKLDVISRIKYRESDDRLARQKYIQYVYVVGLGVTDIAVSVAYQTSHLTANSPLLRHLKTRSSRPGSIRDSGVLARVATWTFVSVNSSMSATVSMTR